MMEIRTECDVEEMLIDAIVESDNPVLEDVEITTFEDFGLITCDRGLVITLNNGAMVYLTIQGYGADGVRMD